MGLGKWRNKTDFPFSFTTTQNMKIYCMTFQPNPNLTHKETWHNLQTKVADMLHRYKYKTTIIFGRSVVVNTYIIPKLIYTATLFNPPQRTVTNINKQVRRFFFGWTIHSIQHKILIQSEVGGGIALQDIRTKTKIPGTSL
jgi:hypothetical protein